MFKRFSVLVCLIGLGGCGPEAIPLEGESEALGVRIGALGVPCNGNPNAFAQVDSIRVCGEGVISGIEGEGKVIRTLFDRVTGFAESFQAGDIPVNEEYRLTVIGQVEGETAYVGQVEGVQVSVGEVQDVNVTWAPFDRPGCVSIQSGVTPFHRIFSAGVSLPDGRYFFGGGFSAYLPSSETGGVLDGASKTFVFNPESGSLLEGPDLEVGRGAHTMVYVPDRQQVLVIGGLREMQYDSNTSGIPFSYDSVSGTNLVEVVDFSGDVPVLVSQAGGNEVTTKELRVFPKAQVTALGEVLITGGFDWNVDPTNNPSANSFKKFESLLSVDTPDGTDHTWQLNPTSPQDQTVRAGHTFNWVRDETTESGKTREVFLLWGGTRTSTSRATVVRADSDGNNIVYPVVIDDQAGGAVNTFFHTMTDLGGGRLLAMGGLETDGSGPRPSVLNGNTTFLLEYSDPDGISPTVSVTKIPGLSSGRYFHTAQFHAGDSVSVFGGFSDVAGTASSDIYVYNKDGSGVVGSLGTPNGFFPRAGHVSAPLRQGGTYLAGGMEFIEDLGQGGDEMLSEVIMSPGINLCGAPVPQQGEGVE